ncbi:hypothetical protein TNCV_2876441 [Trichonephila clavipes]|nr:hypothetical protein TNCV_2876441 [Trichonephila clavipes]
MERYVREQNRRSSAIQIAARFVELELVVILLKNWCSCRTKLSHNKVNLQSLGARGTNQLKERISPTSSYRQVCLAQISIGQCELERGKHNQQFCIAQQFTLFTSPPILLLSDTHQADVVDDWEMTNSTYATFCYISSLAVMVTNSRRVCRVSPDTTKNSSLKNVKSAELKVLRYCPRHLTLAQNYKDDFSTVAVDVSFLKGRKESCQSLRQIGLLYDTWRHHLSPPPQFRHELKERGKYSPAPVVSAATAYKTFKLTDLRSTHSVCTRRIFSGIEPRPSDLESDALTTRQPTALNSLWNFPLQTTTLF